jgi:hypothetical protein
MEVRGRAACVALCAAAVLLTAPASALGLGESTAELSVEGDHGYQIDVSVSPGNAVLSVSKFARGAFDSGSADYLASRGRLQRERVEADFGRLGRIGVRFHPSGKVRRRPTPFCKGGRELVRFGTFVGTIRFRGEEGYTGADRERARGKITTTSNHGCEPGAPGSRNDGGRDSKPRREIVFSARSEAKGVEFSATRMPGLPGLPAENLITASSQERRDGIVILRQVLMITPGPTSFAFDEALSSATLTPPLPFTGSASFQRIDDYASRWEGPLTVSFPGRPAVPLTGRDYSWSLRSQRSSSSSFTTFSATAP